MKIFAGYGMVSVSVMIKYMYIIILKNYQFILDRRFAHPNDLESFAGGSISSW
jgi:hypothetical protein